MSLHKRRYDIYSIIRITTYLVRLPPPLEREEELPAERDAPVDIAPEERIVLEEDERTELLDERDGDDVEDERTALLDERDGVVVVVALLRVG